MNMMTPPEKLIDATRQTISEGASTWHDLCGHWLRGPGAEALEIETLARRQAAVRRWRGMPDPASRP